MSGHLEENLVSGFVVHLEISLSEEEGGMFLRASGVDRMEEPVVEMMGNMEVTDADFEC